MSQTSTEDIAPDQPETRPLAILQAGRSGRIRHGHPWVYSNEIHMSPTLKALAPGTLVTLQDAGGEKLGVGSFNPHSLIAVRLFDRDWRRSIDRDFFAGRLKSALALRDRLIPAPYYRLIHSEADGLPGLILDRYGDATTIQINTAGMERLTPLLLDALDATLASKLVVLRNDSPARGLEGLPLETRIAKGGADEAIEIVENGVRYLVDLAHGQKTGWFFDQRDNRAFVAALAEGRRVLDVYSFVGSFAIQCAVRGAAQVVAVDRSEGALDLAARSAELNGVAAKMNFVKAEAFGEMARLAEAGEKFGLAIVDPPAFVKSKKDLQAGLKGYRKMVKLAAPLVEPGGFLLAASCSHHVSPADFAEQVAQGLAAAGRGGRILRSAGAGPDHPVHPHLPESAYLKAIVLQVD